MYEQYGLYINGDWRAARDANSRAVIDPATEEPLGSIPVASIADLDEALAAAQRAQGVWRRVNPWERSAKMRRVADLLRARVDSIAYLMSAETGKPMAESKGEIQAAADQFEWYAEETKRIYGHTIEARAVDTRMQVIYQPVGVVAAFSAWNFPALLPARKIAAALAAGCPIIIKPASEAPGSCMAIVQCCHDAAIDPGVINLVTGDSALISQYLIESPVVRKVSLTGSTGVGKRLLHLAAEGIKKVSMELGGHAPVIVFEDADGAKAARTAAASKFRNCGQVCVSPTRFFVHESQYEVFATAFADYAKSLKLGAGLDPTSTIGPMVSQRGMTGALALIDDALSGGAELLAGGRRSPEFEQGFFLEPTVLGRVSDGARIMNEEPFAPVAPISTFTRYDEVIARANQLPFGLAAYLFTNNLSTATRAAEDIEAGMVGVNEVLLASAEMPFGGVKESGYGREGGRLGIFEYLEPKFIKTTLQ